MNSEPSAEELGSGVRAPQLHLSPHGNLNVDLPLWLFIWDVKGPTLIFVGMFLLNLPYRRVL